MAMTPYSGDTSVIGKLGTTPQERGLTTQQFKDKFDEGLKTFVEWFNETHNGEINEHMADMAAHGVSHKNLLHNWDFRNPVNQRGQSNYSGAGVETIDRWRTRTSNDFVTVNNGSVTFGKTSGTGSCIQQNIENPIAYIGKTLTFSVKIIAISGTIVLRFFENDTIVKESNIINTTGIHFVTHTVNEGTTKLYVTIAVESEAGNVTLECAKLELGSVSTLANDPPADYREQLMLCKSFLRNIILSPDEADAELMGEGDIWIKYE